ncbi:MAG TPA: response regulator [Sphingobacteriaceae bacterium]|nr:response regulator [Sphingobacteriaceae bacterium]
MKKNIILLIEDDQLDVISVERSLSKLEMEYELFTAFNGIEGLTLLREKLQTNEPLPEVILLDLNMPKMNGIEFLKELRNNEQLKHLNVFVMTTSGEEADRKAADQLGVSGYVIKPLNFNNNGKRRDSMDAFVQFHLRKLFT